MACHGIGEISSKGCIRLLSTSSKEHVKSPKAGEIHGAGPAGGYTCLFPEEIRSKLLQAESPSFPVVSAGHLMHWI